MKCNECNHKVAETDNFCGNCRTKLQEQCHFCWVKKEGNYDCGESNCPGLGLFLILKSKTTAESKGKEFEDVIHKARLVLMDQLMIMKNGSTPKVENAIRVLNAVSEMLRAIL